MLYLGIDPGVRKLGYALIDDSLQIIDAGILLQDQTAPSRSDQFTRMSHILAFFTDMLKNHPDISHVGIEKVFFMHANQSNAEFVFGIRAVLICLLQQHQIAYSERTPLELKQNITGNGKAQKILVQQSIMRLYGLANMPEYDDAADALGLAYLSRQQ